MELITYTDSEYHSPEKQVSIIRKAFPSLCFYPHLFKEIIQSASLAKKNLYDYADWAKSSINMLQHLEKVGLKVHISGIEHLQNDQPAVIIGNHMSMMETVLLPGIVCQIRPATFVVKESLLEYPVFKHVMRSRNPIAVSRTNPRADLKLVMSEGVQRLKENISVIVFPQTTRAHTFSAEEMSSIGIKLAKKAGVPAIPLALKTDAWDNGSIFKDLGKITPGKNVYFSFGKPIPIEGKGSEEQSQLCDFIETNLNSWKKCESTLIGAE